MSAPTEFRVLYLCTGNACRSQFAEAWTNALFPGRIAATSAGTRPAGVDPLAIRVLAECGLPVAGLVSKAVGPDTYRDADWVVTVCDRAAESCPVAPPGVRRLHHGFPDPPRLAADARDEAGRLRVYRDVRDQVRAWVHGLPRRLGGA